MKMQQAGVTEGAVTRPLESMEPQTANHCNLQPLPQQATRPTTDGRGAATRRPIDMGWRQMGAMGGAVDRVDNTNAEATRPGNF